MTRKTGVLQLLNFTYRYPQGWNEVSRRNLLRIFKALAKYGDGSGLFILNYIWICLGLRPRVFQNERTKIVILGLTDEQKIDIARGKNILGWFFDNDKHPIPYKLKWFFHRGRIYVGPHERLTKINISELCFAMYYDQQYHKTKNSDHVYHLIDVLYRPVSIKAWLKRIFSTDPKGDIRVPLNDYLHEKRAKRHSKLPNHIPVLIIAQWRVAINAFAKKYPKAFQKGKNKKKENPADMVKFMISTAGDKFGTIDKAERTPAYKIYEYIQMQMEEAEKLKAKNK